MTTTRLLLTNEGEYARLIDAERASDPNFAPASRRATHVDQQRFEETGGLQLPDPDDEAARAAWLERFDREARIAPPTWLSRT